MAQRAVSNLPAWMTNPPPVGGADGPSPPAPGPISADEPSSKRARVEGQDNGVLPPPVVPTPIGIQQSVEPLQSVALPVPVPPPGVPPITRSILPAAISISEMQPQALAPSANAMHLEGEITTNVIVVHHKAGKVIGKGGEVIASIRDRTGASLHVSEHTGLPERIVTIQGAFAAVHAAFTCVIKLTEEENPESITIRLAVTNDDAGGLIGKAGAVINEVRTLLGGSQQCFQVDPADINKPDQRLVTIVGTMEIVRRGHELVCQKILERHKRKETSGGGSLPNAPSVVPGKIPTPTHMAVPSPMGVGVAPTQVQVPNDRIGNVIGRGGSRINEIRQLSGAKIHIDQAVPGNPNRLVTITGTSEQTQWAQYMISVAMAGGEPSMAMGQPATAVGASGDPYAAAGYTGYGAAGAVAQKAAPVQMQVPNDSMGNVIGRSGANINHIRQLSGANIHIGDIQMNSPYRLVTINGTYEQTQIAQYLINMAMGGGDVKSWSAGDVAFVLGSQQQAGQDASTPQDPQHPTQTPAVDPTQYAPPQPQLDPYAQVGYGQQPQAFDPNMYAQYAQYAHQQGGQPHV